MPLKPILAIHAGSVRRQAKLEVNRPFAIPHPGSLQCSVQVSLFAQLASQVLTDDGEDEAICTIPVRRPDGTASQVKLRVRRAGEGAAKQAQGASKAEEAEVAREYLESHNLQQRIQTLIQDVLRVQPDDPYRFMLSQLRSSQDGARPAVVPVPPAAPPPGHQSGPRKGRHVVASAGGAAADRADDEDDVDGAKRLLADLLKAATPREQVRLALARAYQRSAAILSPEYHRAVTRWTLDLALLNACNLIGGDQEKRDACFDPDDETEFEPLPQPEAVVRTRAVGVSQVGRRPSQRRDVSFEWLSEGSQFRGR